MRLVSYNILDGGLGRADPIAEILQANRPDVIALLEADDHGVVERIARRLKMDTVHAGGKRHSAAILSSLPILDSINFAPVSEEITGSFAVATLRLDTGATIGVGAVHLHPHATLDDEKRRLKEIEFVIGHLQPWHLRKLPHLLAGDFNANSPVQRIDRAKVKPHTQRDLDANGGVIPRDVIARLLAAGFVDTLHAHVGDSAADMGTFSTHRPGQRVDFIFARGLPPGAISDAWIETDRLATYASDHYPVGLELAPIR